MTYNRGMQFTTFDVDNDPHADNCAAGNAHGAWWHKACFRANLNGDYRLNPPPDHTMYCASWYDWKNTNHYCLKFTQMKTRPTA